MFRKGPYLSFCICSTKNESIIEVEFFQCGVEGESSETRAREETISLF